MWSDWTEKASKGLTEALEKTGEVILNAEEKAKEALEKTGEAISQAATKVTPKDDKHQQQQQQQQVRKQQQPLPEESSPAGSKTPNNSMAFPNSMNSEKMFQSFQSGWSSVVESTKRTVEATKEAVDIERARLEQTFLQRKGFHKRDPKLPLDAEALRDAEVVYVTDRIITMSHPALQSSVNPNITPQRKLAAVAHLLQRRHDGRFLVWNLSEVDYDISILDDQVLTFSFPGSPSPPLGLLLKLLISMENWMKADPRNVAVVHCLTGKGRTSTVLASFLCWMGEAGFGDIHQALEYIANCKQLQPGDLTIPSQRRYAAYFKNMLDGVRPSQPPLLLKRIIMSEAPRFANGPSRDIMVEDGAAKPTQDQLMGCAPYLQIFKAGKLIYTTAATLHVQQSDEELPFVQVMDGTIPFNIDEVIQGDILIRCRHLTFDKKLVSMFRAAFHTGYVPPNVLRMTKAQLDGACTDKRFSDDFFLDLIFEKVDTETATKHLEARQAEEVEAEEAAGTKTGDKGKGPVVKASSVDTMLHGDSRFWDVIASRREQHVKQTTNVENDPMFGPTVGRRRGKPSAAGAADNEVVGQDSPASSQYPAQTFSIGNEFDFLPSSPVKSPEKPSEPDALMDALNALDEDDGDSEVDTEEVVFESQSVKVTEEPTSMDAPVFSSTVPINNAQEEDTVLNKPSPCEPETADDGDKVEKDSNTPAPSEPASSTVDDIDDMDALLASADDDLEDFGDLNLDDLDDDEDLEDLEAMLAT